MTPTKFRGKKRGRMNEKDQRLADNGRKRLKMRRDKGKRKGGEKERKE